MAAVASLAAGFVAALVSPAPGAHAAEPADQLGSLPVSGELFDEVTGSTTQTVTQTAAQAATDVARAGQSAAGNQ
ncbi:hypothetical protein ACH4SP_17655 [Streptomyces sp. NPDC021093]|uniref:hypothetical protein n=1 Tax=Streptomyces sp. NPDC021093 TaxID=3365112 RepID=UPI0037BDA07C